MRKLTSDLTTQGRELGELRPKAAEYDKIRSFIDRTGLAPRDVQSVAEIAAMLIHDPVGARQRLMPIMAELDRILGVVLPRDLQEQVDQGYLTLEHAQALSQANAAAALNRTRADRLVEDRQRNETVSRQQQVIDQSLSAMDAWEAQQKRNDPDWSSKQAEVTELVELAIERKARELGRSWFPNSQEATQMLNEALQTVNTRFKRFAPKPTQINAPVTSGASPRSVPAPKNTMDVIKGVLGR